MKYLQELIRLNEAEDRKFKVGDTIKIVSDNYADYGRLLGTEQKIKAIGIKQKGQFTYIVGKGEIRVFEKDIATAVKESRQIAESKDLDELVDAWMEKNNAWRTEGPQGYRNLSKLVRELQYADVPTFLEDNPGAIEALFNWIKEQRVSEWKEALAEFDDEAEDNDE